MMAASFPFGVTSVKPQARRSDLARDGHRIQPLMSERQLRRSISAMCACGLLLLALGRGVLAAILCGPPLLVLLVLDQRRHTAEAHAATASLRARAPQLTLSERKAALDALTARYGGKWTRDVRDTAGELGVAVDKVRLGGLLATSSDRNKRALLVLAGFIGLLVLFALIATAVS
jgi:hypothetical protein